MTASDIFSFSGRIGRLHYFLGSLALGVAVVATIILVPALAFASGHKLMALLLLGLCLLLSMPVMLWLSLALQARRFRDIGWDPIYVIPSWFMVMLTDAGFAHVMPAWSALPHVHYTWVGLLINFGLSLTLLFWPGASDDDEETPSEPALRPSIPTSAPIRHPGAPTVAMYPRPGAPQKLFGPR